MAIRNRRFVRSTTRKQAKKRALLLRMFEQLERRELLAVGANPIVLIPGFGGTFAADENPQESIAG